MRIVVTLAAWLVLASLLPFATAEERLLFDFEQAGLADSWKAQGKLQAGRSAAVEPPAGDGIKPAGSALDIQAAPSSGIASLSGKIPRDWRSFAELSCWVYRSPEEVKRAPKVVAQLRLLEQDGQTHFWRKVELTQAGWQRVAIPLKWFRYGEGRDARWDRIDRFQIWFPEEVKVQIDSIAVTPGADEQSSQLSEKDLRELAFPGADPQTIRSASPAEFLLLTNAKELDVDKLAEHLKKVTEAVRADFPFLSAPVTKPVLLVFANAQEYQAFTPRLAERLGAVATAPKSSGFTVHGLATSSWDPQFGTLRPVYTHEFVHSLMNRTFMLPNRGEWLHEGLASRYQLKFHPQASAGAIVLKGLEDPNLRLPMETLTNGKPIPLDRYWQAMTVIDYLLADERYRKQLPELIADMQKRGSTDLGPLFGKLIEADAAKFTSDWAAWCRTKYAP